MTAKSIAADAVAGFADDVSMDEIIERLYLLRKIQIGIAQADAGQVIEHEEVKRRFLSSAQ